MVELIQTAEFARWIGKLRDDVAVARITRRLERLVAGNAGDAKSVGAGIFELRIPYGPGYRVYCLQRGKTVVVLLCAGDKSTQPKDIAKAQKIAELWKE